MMTPTRFRSLVRKALERGGFSSGKGSVWLWEGSEVSWLVVLDKSPAAQRYTLEIGAVLGPTSALPPNDCPVLIHLENLRPVNGGADFRERAVRAFDLSSTVTDAVREQEIDWVLDTATHYLTGLGELAALKRHYAQGDFESAFVHKDTRAQLSS